MTWPLATTFKITTHYGKRGSYWSCNRDSKGNGIHTGIDLAAPIGTPVYATIAGTVRHRSYGSAFGNHQVAISPSAGQPFEKGEVFYAHMRSRVPDGREVQPGDKIGEVGIEGNVSGPHLHYEFHPNSKNTWSCSVIADPKPTLGTNENDGPFTTKDIYSNKLGFGEPTNGDADSDTVKELQQRLNRVSLVGGKTILVDGKYGDATDHEVRLWQEQVCGDNPDPTGYSYLGPEQTKKMFGSQYTIHESGKPAIAGATPESPGEGSGGSPDPGTELSKWGILFSNAAKNVSAPVYYEEDWDSVAIAGKGDYNPDHVLLHHTAGTNSLNWITDGGEWQPVRLANVLVNRDGSMNICSSRKTYHAGAGGPLHGVAQDDMNSRSIGIEIESMGTSKDLTEQQIKTVSEFSEGLLEEFKKNTDYVFNHKDWRSTKRDTLYPVEFWRDKINGVPVIPPVTPPQPPDEGDLPIEIGSATYWHAYSGKPSGTLTVKASDGYKNVDVKVKAAPVSGNEEHMLYINVSPTWTGSKPGEIRVRYVRDGGDATAYQDYHVNNGETSFLITAMHFEDGQRGVGGQWQVNVGGGISSVSIGTRYCKTHVIAVKNIDIARAAVTGLLPLGAEQIARLVNALRPYFVAR